MYQLIIIFAIVIFLTSLAFAAQGIFREFKGDDEENKDKDKEQ